MYNPRILIFVIMAEPNPTPLDTSLAEKREEAKVLEIRDKVYENNPNLSNPYIATDEQVSKEKAREVTIARKEILALLDSRIRSLVFDFLEQNIKQSPKISFTSVLGGEYCGRVTDKNSYGFKVQLNGHYVYINKDNASIFNIKVAGLEIEH